MISHGTGGMWLNHYPIAEVLARADIVASFDHPGDNYRDRSMIADPAYFHERSRQISRVLDTVLVDLAVGRSQPNRGDRALGRRSRGRRAARWPPGAGAAAHALRDRHRRPGLRPARPGASACRPHVPTSFAWPDTVSASGPVSADPRIRAMRCARAVGAAIADGSLAQATQPIRLIGAEHDEVLARHDHYEHLRAQLPRAQASLAAGAGHFAFIAPIEPD
ncbi:MAG: hypothetical protein R3E48_15970 [Burkholderiaceae bacterium]